MIEQVKYIAALLSVLIMSGCSNSTGPGDGPGDPPVISNSRCGAKVVEPFSPQWMPLPAADKLKITPEVQAARDAILGPNATDPRQVRLWWYGVSSFVASVGGHLFLFDAWEIVGLHQDYAPIGRDELVAIAPEVIFIGHGHFDHAGDAGYVAGRTGALLVAGQATCNTAREQAAIDDLQDNFDCLILGNAGEPQPGIIQRIRIWEDVEPVSVLRHTHSDPDPTDLGAGGLPLIYYPELIPFLTHLNTDPVETVNFLQSLDDEAGNDPAGGTWAYHLRVGDFTLLWHDTAGPVADGKPFAKEIQCALDSFPGCVDVMVGTILAGGAVTSGMRDVGLYPRHAHPKIHMPNHHDVWTPVLGPGAEAVEQQWRTEIASMENPPEIDYLNDPEDYMVVRSYAVNDPVWKSPMPGSSCAPTP